MDPQPQRNPAEVSCKTEAERRAPEVAGQLGSQTALVANALRTTRSTTTNAHSFRVSPASNVDVATALWAVSQG